LKKRCSITPVAIALEGDYRTGKIARGTCRLAISLMPASAAHAVVPDPESAWKIMETNGIRLHAARGSAYPKATHESRIHRSPLYSKGGMTKENLIPFSIVGTRRATPEGKNDGSTFRARTCRGELPPS